MFDTLRNGLARKAQSGLRFILFRHFARDEKGATAVEFSMVALPFLGMIFAIVETAMVFFAGQTLETALANAGRKIMTGQAESWDQATFKQEVCKSIFGLFDCDRIQVNVKAYSSFGAATMDRPVDGSGNIVTAFEAGGPGDIIIARLMYDWPIQIPVIGLSDGDRPNSSRLLIATAAFRNEPYK
jgi:Flp pilus assembly pilin Flp